MFLPSVVRELGCVDFEFAIGFSFYFNCVFIREQYISHKYMRYIFSLNTSTIKGKFEVGLLPLLVPFHAGLQEAKLLKFVCRTCAGDARLSVSPISDSLSRKR